MVDRTIKAIITASASGLISELNKASAATAKFGKDLDSQSANLDRISTGLLGIGTAAAAGLAGAAKAAIDWESAWAGVAKTVDGSAADLAGLQDELRQMARSLPASHTEIAAVAEAAGQLGVRTDDIAGFTKTMIALGETTNLSADEAATSLAQFMNIMGTAGEDVDRLGSTIVALGNSGASTEKQIVDMGQRIAGAGNQIGLSETDVLGFASALASVGIEAEAGGTAISTSFLKIEQAVRGGGDQLAVLAETAGMTTEEFRAAFEDNAAGAVEQFIAGLDRAQKSGGDTTAILKDLGITGIRESDALRRLAGAGDLLSKSLDDASQAWTVNNALAEEAAKRYATTEAQVQIAWNNIQDAAIEAGAVLLPIISDVAEQIAELAQWFGDLPDPVKDAGVAIAGIVAAVGLLGGGALKAVTGVAQLTSSLTSLRSSGSRAEPVLGKLAKGVGLVGAALVTAQIAGSIGKATGAIDEFTPSVEKAADALIKAGQANDGKTLDELFTFSEGGAGGPTTNHINGIADALKRINDNNPADAFQGFVANLFGGTTIVQDAVKTFGELDRQLAQMPFEESAKAFDLIRQKAQEQGVPVEKLIELFPEYADRLRKTGQESGYTFTETGKLADAMGGDLPPALDKANSGLDDHAGAARGAEDAQKQLSTATVDLETAQADLEAQTQDMIDSLGSLKDRALSAERASINFEASLDDLAASTKDATKAGDKHAKSLDADTESGRKNRSAVLDSIEALNTHAGEVYADAAATGDLEGATKDASEALKDGKEDIRAAGKAAGLSEDEIEDMIDEMVKTPKELATDIETPGMKAAQRQIDDLKERIRDLESKTINITTSFKVSGTVVDFDTGKTNRIGNKRVNTDGSWHTGGFTGHGGKFEPAGEVHKGEVVFEQEAVAAAGGPDRLDQFRRDLRAGTAGLYGYAYGGIVGRRPRYLADRPTTLSGRPRGLGGRPTEEEELDVHGALLGRAPKVGSLISGYVTNLGDYALGEMTAAAKAYAAKAEKALESALSPGQTEPNIDVNNPRGLTNYRGGTFTNLFAANLRRAEDIAGQTIRVFQGGWRPRTSYSGTSHQGDAIDLQVSSALIRALRSVGIAAWDRTGKGNWAPHVHAVPSPKAGYAGGSAIWQWQDYTRGGDGLGAGGLVKGWSPNEKADNVPVWATAGEFMQPVDAVEHYGTEFMEAVRTKQFPRHVIAHRYAPTLTTGAGSWSTAQGDGGTTLNLELSGNFGWDADRAANKVVERLQDAMSGSALSGALP